MFLTESALFADRGIPLRVKDAETCSPTGVITAEAVKIVFGIEGAALVRSAHESLRLDEGAILTIPPGVACCALPECHARTVTFYIQSDYVKDQLRWLSTSHPLVHLLKNAVSENHQFGSLHLPPKVIRSLTPRLTRLSQISALPEYEFASLSLASDVIHSVGRSSGMRPDSAHRSCVRTAPRQEILRAMSLLRTELDRAWRIEDLSQEVALSTSQLGRLFRDQVGVSPAAYLAQRRAERMAELLATSHAGVSEAARTVGWHNATVAARVFKRRYGTSPRSFAAGYRTEHRAD